MTIHATVRLLSAILIAIVPPIAATAGTEDVPESRKSLITLESRVFDFGIDVRRMRRDPHFIPVTDVPWINALLSADPYMRYTVVHINSFTGFLGKPIWRPDEDREKYAPAEDLAEAWALRGYDVRWGHKIAPSNRGDVYLFPTASSVRYYVSCGYERADAIPTFCATRVLYPPKFNLRVLVRIYKVTDPLNDFEAIAKRALDLVHCLDVTRAVEDGTWKPLQVGQWQSLTEFLSTCRNVSS